MTLHGMLNTPIVQQWCWPTGMLSISLCLSISLVLPLEWFWEALRGEAQMNGFHVVQKEPTTEQQKQTNSKSHMRGNIWETHLIEETPERHLRGMSHWGDVWEASEKHISLKRHLRSIWEAYLIEEAWMWQFRVPPGFSDIYQNIRSRTYVYISVYIYIYIYI